MIDENGRKHPQVSCPCGEHWSNFLFTFSGLTIMFNRHQLLMAGLMVLLLGAQFRLVETYVFADTASPYIEPLLTLQDESTSQPQQALPLARQYVLHVPDWMGWLLLSIGGALVLHSLSIPGIRSLDSHARGEDR